MEECAVVTYNNGWGLVDGVAWVAGLLILIRNKEFHT